VTYDSLDSDAAVAPSDYLLTTGVCNDDEEGWACDPDTPLAEGANVPLGVTSGRTGCIEVDCQGFAEGGDSTSVASSMTASLLYASSFTNSLYSERTQRRLEPQHQQQCQRQ
jgi:hypothetical protein